ncbi:hypothetical protein GLOIN_2v1486366 [Rhizophagus clarus]|uniref:Uncharacterized protein n=1 Tax=Rhizophagus clarus TaxID=94130 RepID=A0A8H3LIP2_9GLOM|nr:hypothetical protein GLOIN_2v1486366 [Rhizophagus clarus]
MRHQARGYFTALYFWFWIFDEIFNEWEGPILRDWTFVDYKKQQDICHRQDLSHGSSHESLYTGTPIDFGSSRRSAFECEWNVECNDTIVDVMEFKNCIINVPSSPYSDAFLSLDQPDAKKRKRSLLENDFFRLQYGTSKTVWNFRW